MSFADTVHRCRFRSFRATHKFLVPPDVIQDMILLRTSLRPTDDKGHIWSRPIGLLIPRTPTNVWLGDAAYEGLGGFCSNLESCGDYLSRIYSHAVLLWRQ